MTSHTTYLHRIEPAHNCYRYYILSLQPGLFDEWCLTRSWGRMGSKGRHLIVWFESKEQAEQVYERTRRAKLRRGYQPTLVPSLPRAMSQPLAIGSPSTSRAPLPRIRLRRHDILPDSKSCSAGSLYLLISFVLMDIG